MESTKLSIQKNVPFQGQFRASGGDFVAVLYSGGSNGVGEWKVDNAVLNVARRPQATAGTSTILVK